MSPPPIEAILPLLCRRSFCSDTVFSSIAFVVFPDALVVCLVVCVDAEGSFDLVYLRIDFGFSALRFITPASLSTSN